MLLFCNVLTGGLYDSLGPFLVPWKSKHVEFLMFSKVRSAQKLLVCLRVVPGVLLEPPRPLKATWKLLKTKTKSMFLVIMVPIGSLLDLYPKAPRLCYGHGWWSLRWVVPCLSG